MGRDDARALGNLQGGNAPATAWAAYMRVATAKRPVENFATDVTFPERLEGEEVMLGENGEEIAVDENGNPIEGELPLEPGAAPDEATEPEALDEEWIDRALGRNKEKQPVEADPELADPQ
jgi:penicillin-binding protein 1A